MRRGAAPTPAASVALAAARAGAGLPVRRTTLDGRRGRAVELADRLGAPRGPALAAAATAASDADERAAAVAVASAEGRSVARSLVLLPPVVGPALAWLVAEDPWAVWGTTVGRGVLLVVLLLWLAGAATVRAMVAAAGRPPGVRDGLDDELLELAAVAVGAGLPLPAALREAGAVLGAPVAGRVASWLELGGGGSSPAGWDELAPVLRAAVVDGLPAGPLLRGLAADRRRAEQRVALERAARLGARLSLPTTLLLLPAALLVVVTPVLAEVTVVLGG